MSNDEAYESFLKIGLNERTAKETIANENVTNNLLAVINEAGVTDGCHKSIGNLLYTVATKFPAEALVRRPKLLEYIVSSKIKTAARLEDAFTYLTETGSENLDIDKFEEACGVGIEVSEEAIAHIVDKIFKEKESDIKKQSYGINVGFLITHVLKKLPGADRKTVKELIDPKLNALLGEKTAADNEKPVKKKKEKHAKVEDKSTTNEAHEAVPSEEENPFSKFPAPEKNNKMHTEVSFSNGNKLRPHNSPKKLKEHLDATGRKVRTRFPPEPNGYLHIGHAKAMYVDFGLAEYTDGDCYLRFDDTNPEAEKTEYIEHIKEIVEWLGWKPFKITYTSDYFQKLYELAVKLIEKGHAYVDHQTADEIKAYRAKKMNSPWRDRPISESLKLFNDMKEGKDFEEGTPTLRMKQDMQNDNGNMYDLIAYRLKKTPHPRTGDKWCIYPTYDYSHCIVDSLENITHSLCTLEFETRRASYYWLLHVLDLYQPYVGEYSRLNITYTVMSKRKLNRLVTENHVDGWDDPRLMTLAGLRRRGVTSTAINMFVKGTGISRSDGSVKQSKSLDSYVRKELNETAPRTMVVLDPLKVVITNLDADLVVERDAKKWPNNPNNDTCYKVPFSKVVYIERTDCKLEDSKDYKGLAPGKTVLLKYAYLIKCTEVVLSEDKKTFVEIHAEYVPDEKTTIPKGIGKLHWVAEPSSGVDPLKVEVRLFNKLFNSENPGEPKDLNPESNKLFKSENPGEPKDLNPDDWLEDLNPKSKVVIPCAYAVPSLKSAKVGDTFQFERHGYFVVDKDSTPEKLVFNQTVALKDLYTDKPESK